MSTLSMAASVVVGAGLLWSVAPSRSMTRTVAAPEVQAPPTTSTDVSSRAALDVPVESAAAAPPMPVEALPAVRAPATPVRRAAAGKTEPAASCTICEERALLEVARRGLRDEPDERTLAAIEEHQSRFPAGQLAEERESLRVHVLFALGRVEEAEARKSDFLRAFPRSPLLESVKRAGTR